MVKHRYSKETVKPWDYPHFHHEDQPPLGTMHPASRLNSVLHSSWVTRIWYRVPLNPQISDLCELTIYWENFSLVPSVCSDSFTILDLWVLGLAVSHINESNCKLTSSILLHPGTRWKNKFAAQRQNYAQKMQDAQVTKSLVCVHWAVDKLMKTFVFVSLMMYLSQQSNPVQLTSP